MSSHNKQTDLFQSKLSSHKYRQYRVPYPESLPGKIFSCVAKKREPPYTLALDVACGTGLGTRIIAKYFQQVIGVDISSTQIAEATAAETLQNVTYQVGTAESLPAEANSADLITVATGIQWLDIEKFYIEVDRVLKPGGCLVVYGNTSRNNTMHFQDKTEALSQLYNKTLFERYGQYWTYRNTYQWNYYRDLPLPYDDNERDDSMIMSDEITVTDLMGYTSSLSFFEKYQQEHPNAENILWELQNSMMEILGVETPPEETVIRRDIPLFLVSSRKPLMP